MIEDVELTVLQLLQKTCTKSGCAITIARDQRLSDLGIDSMKMVEMTFELEKYFGIEMQETTLSQVVTVMDLISMVLSAVPASRLAITPLGQGSRPT